MSVRVPSGSPIIDISTHQPRSSGSTERPFLELTTAHGLHLIAFTEAAGRGDSSQLDVARDIMRAVEGEARSAGPASIEELLERIFAAANRAMQERNRARAGADPLRRVYSGLVVACLDGDRLVIGLASPAQAVVFQGGAVFAFPAIPGLDAPRPATWTAAALGMFAASKPALFETVVSSDDLLLLGGRGLTQSLDPAVVTALLDGRSGAIETGLERALATSPASGHALIGRIGDFGSPPKPLPTRLPAPPIAAWSEPVPFVPRATVLDDDLPAQRLDRWHIKLIDASERWFARKDGDAFSSDAARKRSGAVGASSVHRYQPRHAFPSGMRTRLPRAQLPWLSIAIVVALTVVIGGGAFGYNARQTRASRQATLLGVVQTQFDKARATTNQADGLAAVTEAESALRSAEQNGASVSVVQRWRGELATLGDFWQGIHRFAGVVAIGALPGDLHADGARLVQTGVGLFVIAGAVYQFDASGTKLTALLRPGAVVDGRTAGQLTQGSSDGDDLVVSDGKTLFRWNPKRQWTSDALPATPKGAWTAPLQDAYLGNYYLLDPAANRILKFTKGQIGADPSDWLSEGTTIDLKDSAGFSIDGGIFVLHKSGALESLYKGISTSSVAVSYEPGAATEVALVGGPGLGYLYVLERGAEATRLIRIDPTTGKRVQFQVAAEGQPNFSQESVDAFARATSFAVNETTGIVVFLSGGRVWQATLPSTN